MKFLALLSTLQAVLGAALTTRPDASSRLVAGGEHPPPPTVVRVLGLRTLAQAVAVTAAARRRRHLHAVLLGGVGVDAAHAASMVAAAAWKPAYRRSALASAGAAALSAGMGLVTARRVAG